MHGISYHEYYSERTVKNRVVAFFYLLPILYFYCASASAVNSQDVIPQLEAAETKDRILSDAAGRASKQIKLLADSIDAGDVRLFVIDFSSLNGDIAGRYKTDGCKAIFRHVPQPIIICNAAFLLELEAVLRSAHFPNRYFQSDEAMFAFVESVGNNPFSHLQRLRDRKPPPEQNFEEHMVQHMKLLIIFFGAHEVGHIMQNQNNRDYIATMRKDAPLEHKLANSVVKMCMHAEDLNRIGFRLDGFGDVSDTENRIRLIESDLRSTAENAFFNQATIFEIEAQADQVAERLIIDYFNNLELKNKMFALEEQQLFVRSLFFVGVYSWYKDLSTYLVKGCHPLNVKSSTDFSICMFRNREQYISVSSMFGKVHRSTILRAYIVIEAIVEKRLGFFLLPVDERSIWISQKEIDQLSQNEAALAIWRAGTLQNYALLQIIMDAPIKLSLVGCATGWFKEIDKKRGSPQGFLIFFETLEQALQRLLELK